MTKRSAFIVLIVFMLPLAACGEPEPSNLPAGAGATQEAITQNMVATRQAKTNAASSATATQTPSAGSLIAAATATVSPASPTPTDLPGEPTATSGIPDVLSEEPAGYLLSRLPPLVAFPEGFAITREGRSTAESLSQIYLNPQSRSEYQQYLEHLGLQRAALRFYDLIGATHDDALTRMVHMRAHVLEFSSWDRANEWMYYERDRLLRCECDMSNASIVHMGEESVAVHGINSGTDTGLPALAVVWVRQGSTVWEVEAESLEHDTLPDAVEIMQATLAQPDDRLEVTLPWTLNVPNGFVVTRAQSQSSEEVAEAFAADPLAHQDRLQQWGFVQAHIRTLTLLGVQPHQTEVLVSQVVEYGSPEQAAEALTFEHSYAQSTDGMVDVQVVPLGAGAAAATGTHVADDGTTREIAIVWVQISNRVYAYGGTSQTHPPLPEVHAIAAESLARTGD